MALFEEHPTTIRFLCTYKHRPSERGVSSLHTDQIYSVKKIKMNKDLKLVFFSILILRYRKYFPQGFYLKNKSLLLHSFVLGLQLSQEIVHSKCIIFFFHLSY